MKPTQLNSNWPENLHSVINEHLDTYTYSRLTRIRYLDQEMSYLLGPLPQVDVHLVESVANDANLLQRHPEHFI